ncbi:MAG TPA: hypothetical protein DCL38_01205, partial [Lachnospiraceae bacterium]|nr:hypothetical protein [Lachnospiraceae bacterium]
EARLRSGTCITVDMALEQGKDVAVVPGRITDPLSAGCIRLLKQGAVPVASAEDIVSLIVSSYNEYPGLLNKAAGTDRQEDDNKDIKDSPASAPAEETSLSPEERRLFGVLDYYAKSADKLCDESGLGIPEFMNAVMQLKIKGFVKELGKDCFVRVL